MKRFQTLSWAFQIIRLGHSCHSQLLRSAPVSSNVISLTVAIARADILCSMDPAELRILVDRSLEIHTALSTKKQRFKSEEEVYQFARGSIVADRDLVAGTRISESDIWARRPGTGEISIRILFAYRKRVKRPIKFNQQLSWGDLNDDRVCRKQGSTGLCNRH